MAQRSLSYKDPSTGKVIGIPIKYDEASGKIVLVARAVSVFGGLLEQLPIQESGTTIDYKASKIYNTPSSPGSGDISDNLTGAVLGVVQKLYHKDSSVPNVPSHWVNLSGGYTTDSLNIYFVEYVSDNRAEYWIR